MLTARRQVQVAFLGLALLLVVLYTSAAFQPQYPQTAAAPVKAPTGRTFEKSSEASGILERLESILQKLENTPILPYDEALKRNEQTCRGRQVQSNPDQVAGERTFWREVTSDKLKEKRQNVIESIRKVFGLPGLKHSNLNGMLQSGMYGRGRGLVFTGGNKVSLFPFD